MDRALEERKLLFSTATFQEFHDVLHRSKFDKYFGEGRREGGLERLKSLSEPAVISRHFKACRDPADDKFLDVAVNGGEDFILTGDAALLELHPFQGVSILTPADYLKLP